MKKFNYILLFVLIAVSTVSCNKLLEIKPEGYVLSTEYYYNNEDQLDFALRGVYAILAEGSLYGNNLIARMGLGADEQYCEYPNDMGTVTYYSVNGADSKVYDYWRILYNGINRANALLSHIDDPAIEIDTEKRNSIKGEALFLRGYFYFMLVNRFGGVPLITAPVASPESKDTHVPRSTRQGTFELILSDMTEAADLVRNVSDVESGGRVSKSVVWGMLARVCLYMAGNPLNDETKYKEAENWAYKVIQTGYHALNPSYQQVFINYAQDRYDVMYIPGSEKFGESIWEVEFYGNGTGVYTNTGGYNGIHNGIKYPSTGTAGFGYSNGIAHPSKWLYDLYDEDDVRRDWTIAPYRYVEDIETEWPSHSSILQRYCGKFRRENEIILPKTTTATPQNFPLLRYADVLLIYAEAVNESNMAPNEDALNAINQVRRRSRGLPIGTPAPSVDLNPMSHSTFKNEVKKERAREFAFELLRKDDLIRWGDFLGNMKIALLDVPEGSGVFATSARSYFSNASERDVIWPIPTYELGVNPKLVQNQGW
ncbi:RagB/SusD family nutrient uptake outer membrane protein [Sphingobacterium sp. SGG-5]|uniref:RagB/SusD family nutrient uptake outer membrane protein n=1 Tax=Sphingobacterium sp. SGG-5 TaxID=2710881 RepID=UPI0013EE2242|nr:RagB/SusD family nutrient uptake outer membrane protein [Sphingobacterium sp. SGG-5]NGM61482.1 RagB/SusD family nutrient uptake outer membrane protein [Sphingobacterium sp. SGG-5]